MKKYEFKFTENSFDILKYWAAFSVMFLHYTYYAFTEAQQAWKFMDILRKISEFFPGVIVLFTISGFLISNSLEQSKNNKEFVKKRILRLYPQLWLCTLVNLVVLSLIARQYLDKSIILWIFTQIVGIANTPTALKEFATGSINGALWTIFVEVQLYTIVCIGYKRIKKLSVIQWFFLLSALVISNISCGYLDSLYGGIVSKLIERSFLPYALWFTIGVFCYRYKENIIVFLRRLTIPMIACYWIICMKWLQQPGYYKGIGISICCPFIIMGLSYLLPAVRLKTDLTYGMFLYHWVVLNVIVHFQLLSRWKWYICLIFFILVTLFASWISQIFEKRVLRALKIYDKRG